MASRYNFWLAGDDVNNVLGQIKWKQMILEGNPEFGVELQPIDFAKVAEGCGARGFTLEHPAEAERVLREALAHKGSIGCAGGG